jgi:hypothetical protein
MEVLERAGNGEARLRLRVPAGGSSAGAVRPALAELIAEADPVMIEQIAVLVGALTSGGEADQESAPFEVGVETHPHHVAVTLRDPDFARHRSDAGMVSLERSMLTSWRLRLLERLADRWTLSNEGGLTLRFELDAPSRPKRDPGETRHAPDPTASNALGPSPIGGPGSIHRSTRSGGGAGGADRRESHRVDHQ